MEGLFFKSTEHKQRLITTIQRIGKVYDGGKRLDVEYGAALYVLTANTATWDRVQSYVDRDGIGFEEMMLEVDFSSGYVTLVKLAWNLFNGQGSAIDPLDLVWLDEQNFRIALTALWIRRDGLLMEDLQ